MSRVSGYQPIEPYSPGVSAYLPELAVASYRAGLPQQDLQQINTWSKLYDKHRELLKMDNKDANEEFFKLDEGIQEALKSTFDNPDYLNKPNNWTILGTIGSIAKGLTSPITYGMKALQGYSQALTGTVGGTLAYAKQTGQYTPSMLNFWADDWDGKRIWNVEYTKKLEETYGTGMSALAKGLVTGWTPGRVIEEAGGVTPELETALAFMQENPGDFATILGDYRRAQVSPGREVARRQMRLSPDASLIEEKVFDRISGTYDATFQILADPLTWATAGTWAAGKALVKSIPAGQRVGALAKLTLKENLQPRAPIINKGAVYGQLWKKGIKPELAVPAVFGLDDVKKVWDGIPDKTPGLGPLLKQFREGTPEVRTRVMTSIAENYPAYNNDAIVRKLAFGEIYPTFSKMGPNKYIEDSDSAAQYFINADHTKDLFSGKSNSMIFYRTNNVVTATKSSLWANSIRKSIGDIFSSRLKGSTDVNLFEAIQKTDNVVDTAYLEGKYIEVGADVSQSLRLISDLRQSDPLFKFAATQMKTFPSRVNKLVSRAPLGRPIFTNDDMVGETLNTFRDTARLVLPKEEAGVLTQRFAELKEYDRIVLLRGLYTDILHSSGLAATPGGATIVETILKEKFGGMGTFATGNVLDIPKNLQVSDLARVGAELGSNSDKVKVQSPLHNFQFTPGIGQLDWLEIAKLQSDSARVFKGLRRLGVIINGQAVSQYTNAWTLLTLAPKLGIRATMDELFLFALYGPKEVMYNFVRGTGRTAVKLLAIAKGKPEGLSLTGEHLFRIQEMIKPEERIALQKAIEIEFPGDFSTQKSVYVNRIFGLALDKLKIEQNLGQYIPGSKFLSDANIEHLREFFENNPLGFDALASSQARTAGLSGGFIRPTEDLMTNEVMETAMKERGVQNAGKWVNLPGSAAKEQRVLGQYSNVSARFTSNYEKFGIKSDTPQQIFLRNNGLETQQDFTNAVTDLLKLFGVKLPAGKTYLDLVKDAKSGLLTISKPAPSGPTRILLDSLSEYATLKGTASDLEILTRWIEQHLLDLRKSFHGSADLDVFNAELFNKVKQGTIKQLPETTSSIVKNVPMRYAMPKEALRKDLREQYPTGTSTLKLIQDGKRTSTTRNSFAEIGDIIRFQNDATEYIVTKVVKPDLTTPTGRAKWEDAEGWSLDYINSNPNLRAQVYSPNAVQTFFEPKTISEVKDTTPITSFRNDNSFLSNFFESPVTIEGITYRNSEAAFQAMKTLDVNVRKEFQNILGAQAKIKGKTVKLRNDWNSARVSIMETIVRQKFNENPDLAQKLIETKSRELREGNTWGDSFWGVTGSGGQNQLGKILMKVRDELLKKTPKDTIDKVVKPFRWNQLPIEEYGKLVENHLIAGELLVPFQAGPTNLKEWIAEYGTKIFEAMDQQVTSYFRTPVFMSFYLERMENFAKGGFRESYANQIVLKTVADREYQLGRKLTAKEKSKSVNFANELTAKAMVEYSVQDSLNSIMKFADNPDVRTALAWNLRNGSRFYRATEDFIRRLYRLKEHSLKTIMRMRLSALGLSASGFIHEDAQGQGYLVMPMDDLIFQVVDKPLRVLTGGKSGYSQPLVGDFTFKLQQLNPSFGPDAASPTLSGPLASLNIYLVKSLLGRLGPDGRYAADKIDNILLGDIGDNLDLKKAVLPLSVNRLWSIIGAGEKDKQEASAVHQVIAYNAAHGNGLPVDATPEEQYEYIKNIRISGHNLVVMRNILGLLPIPVSPTLKETKDIPNFLKEVGIVSVRQEFFDIFEGVLSSPNPRIDDPYEEALAIYIGKNPNKLIYTVSRAEKTSDIAFKKTEEVKNWYIKNKGLVEKYGEAAWLAAPSVGDFTAGTYAWFEAADLIDNRDLETYLREVQIAVDRQNYFDLEEKAVEQIAQTADSYAIKEIGAQMNMAQEMLLNSNPLLKQRFATGDFGVEKEKQYFTNLSYLLADNSVEMDPATRDKLNRALRIMSNTAYKINSDNNMSSAYRRTIRDEAISDLSELGNIDYTVRQATKAIFIPILKDLSRDTQIK